MLARYRASAPLEFCCPGHRAGRQADTETVALLGPGAFAHDVTQVPDIDDLLNPRGAIAEAQRLAADLWGARETHFLVNGTSSGIQAAFLATCGAGDVVAVPRAAHRSVLEGFILSGAVPRWIECAVDPLLGCALPPSEDALRAAAPGARMLVLTRPTYFGDVAGLTWSQFLHDCGTILVVDEAWGAHLGFHPETPPSACRAGADLVVNSTHKTAGALSGGAMLHLASGRVDAQRVASAVRVLTTTSAYYGTLASLDGARRAMSVHGFERMALILQAARRAREELLIQGIDVADPTRSERFDGVAAFDETRLVFSAARHGWNGVELADILRRRYSIQVEHAEPRCVVALLCGDADADASDALVKAVGDVIREPARATNLPDELPCLIPSAAMTPREAFQSAHAALPLDRARGRVAAELVCPYPPGMPALAPGERVSADVLDVLRTLRARGVRLQGCADPTLETLRVVR